MILLQRLQFVIKTYGISQQPDFIHRQHPDNVVALQWLILTAAQHCDGRKRHQGTKQSVGLCAR